MNGRHKKERTSEDAQSTEQLDYSTYLRSKAITKETRLKSYIDRPVTRKEIVLNALGDEEMTARQVMEKLGYTDPNMVRPRLTELMKEGLVKVTGESLDPKTKKHVAIYGRTEV